jgi:hypothetical protein
MRINLGQLEDLVAELASDTKRMNDLLDHSTRTSNPDVLVAAWAVLVELQPVLNTSLAKELVAIVTFLGLSTHFKAYLAENKPREFLAYFEATYAIWVITHRTKHNCSIVY